MNSLPLVELGCDFVSKSVKPRVHLGNRLRGNSHCLGFQKSFPFPSMTSSGLFATVILGIVNRTPSHRVFSRTFGNISSLFTCTAWLKVSHDVSSCRGRKDRIHLQLPRGATGSSREQSIPQSTAPVTRLIDTKSLMQVTPYHGDVASFLGWKWSFLIAVRAISKPVDEGLKKIEDNMNQDFRKSRLSIEDLEFLDQAYTLLALLCKDDACAYVRSVENGNGYQAWQALFRARTARMRQTS